MQKNSGSQSFSCQSPDVKKHKKTSTDENSLSSQVPESEFSQTSYFEDPIRMHEEEDNVCPVCGSGFFHINSLMQHMQRHTEKNPFSCKMCGKKFSQFYHLKEHIQVHKDRNHILVKFVDQKFHKVLP